MTALHLPRHCRPRAARQRGVVTVVAILFVIFTVIFALAQMLSVSGGNVIDGQRQDDSNAAFFLAESGLDKAQAQLTAALAGSYSNTSCTNIPAAASSPYGLGRGTVALTAQSTPATCTNGTATPCTACTFTSTGKVGNSTRTLIRGAGFTSSAGVYCNGATTDCKNSPTVNWQLSLTNNSGFAGVGVFVLSYSQQGNNSATCAAGSNCVLQIATNSPSNGVNSVGIQGNVVTIPNNTTYPIYQIMNKAGNNLAEVGGFFFGSSAAPVPTGGAGVANIGRSSFWDNARDVADKTVGDNSQGGNNVIGGAADGTASSNTSACLSPVGNDRQECTSWCWGGDTLIYSWAGGTNSLNDFLTGVTFGTNTGVGQNLAMTQLARYPNSSVAGAPTNVDAEIWYLRNPNLTGSTPLGVNASSYKGRGTAAVGASWTDTNVAANQASISGTTLTIPSGSPFTGTWPAQVISPGAIGVGDTISATGVTTATILSQISSFETGGMTTGRGGRGTYQISVSQNVSGSNGRVWTVNSNVLNVSACTLCFLAASDAVTLTGLSTGRTLTAQTAPATTYGRTEVAGGLGRYTLSGAATRVASNAGLQVGTPGTTLYLPSTSSQPAVTSPQMLVLVKSGTGLMPPGTLVTGVASPNAATTSFTVNQAPTTPLDLATICAGTCAFFVPGATSTTNATTFRLTTSQNINNIREWSSGFTCLKGVDVTPLPVTSLTTARPTWSEQVN